MKNVIWSSPECKVPLTSAKVKTVQDTTYTTAQEYRDVVSRYWIIPGRENLNCHEKINLRYNIRARASGVTDQLLIRFDRRDI